MKNPRDIIFQPIVSEKSYDLIEDENTYCLLYTSPSPRDRS